MNPGQLLDVEPQELQFSFERGERASCSVWLTNRSRRNVAFKVKTSGDPYKYSCRPSQGVILPQEIRELVVTMRAPPRGMPPDMNGRDRVVIQSILARSWATSNDINSDMFRRQGIYVERHELRATYITPPHVLQMREFDSFVREELLRPDGYVRRTGTWFVYGFLLVVFFYLIQKTLSLIWSFMIVLVMKMVMKIVSDYLEDWVVRALVYVIVHFILRLWQ